MAENRFFRNPFKDYSGHEHVIDPATGEYREEEKLKIIDGVGKLLHHLEKRIPKETDFHDFSVYTGVCGYAFLYLHLSEVLGGSKTSMLESAAKYSNMALSLRLKRCTFLCGAPGPLAVGAVVCHKKGLASESNKLLKKLVAIDVSSEDSDELLYGRVGYLYALLYAKKQIPSQCVVTDRLIRNVIDFILASGKKVAHNERKSSPLFYYWHGKAYVGAAHGIAGILYLLLECKEYLTESELNEIVRPSIDFVTTFRFPSGNYMSSEGSGSDRLVQWCHGSPGPVYLFTAAYKIFNDEAYLAEAKKCAEPIWQRGLLTKGYGLCHGAAGNAYAFIRLYQVTKEEKYAYRSLKFCEWCLDYGSHGCPSPDRPLSLFEGLAGTIYFLADSIAPGRSCFPGFQLSV